MFNAFMADKSPFKTRLLMTVFLSLISVGASIYLSQLCATKLVENNRQKAEFTTQSEWLKKFDYKDATNLYKLVLKPCKLADIDKVQSEQLALLKEHKLTVLSVKNDALKDKPDKKIPLKYRKTTVSVSGSWNDIMAALSEFEKKNLVIITNSSFALNDKAPTPAASDSVTQGQSTGQAASGEMKATLEYNIYFN